MNNNIKMILLVIFGIIALYIFQINNSDYNLNKTISACIVAQKQTSEKFDPKKQLCRSDVVVGNNGLLVTIRWSKTNQFGGRAHVVPLVAIPGSPLCPVGAVYADVMSWKF